MAEATSNIELAHEVHEQGHHGGGSHPHRQEWIEILAVGAKSTRPASA